jgi:hypothetical protein
VATFDDIQESVREWFEATTGLHTVWENATSRHHIRLKGYGMITRPATIQSIGQDFVKFEDDPDNVNQLIPTVYGRRKCAFLCKAIVRAHKPLNHATFYIEKARTSLVKPSVLEHFQASGIAIVECRPTINYYNVDKHIESTSAFELVVTYLVSESDTSIGTIGSIEVSSTLKNTDGTELPHPPNLTDEIFSEPE